MININNKRELEIAFSQDFGSPYFPILADIYMREGDIKRSRRVCEVGLEHSPENSCGKFILAKIAIIEEKPIIAERWLKQVVNENPGNFKALRILIRLKMLLRRSPRAIQTYISIILEQLPNDKECNDLLHALENKLSSADVQIKKTSKEKDEAGVAPSTTSVKKNPEIVNSQNYAVESSMATLSMLTVLKNQKHYQQAMAVLKTLAEKDLDPQRIKKEEEEIQSLIKKSTTKI